ncbi:CoA transferase [Tsuneonella flava]|uniref:CoA transferase n=1 Tax=Tsuneonella flava TaxID=2055955 RepID=A0ABX7KC08_9SPHN|nr:CoA transferase [Tsuneonella flava]QSB45801.1 CoA transferase [Tsuneonella flava]
MSGPLVGIRVLDIATFLAAPFCGTILADFGAEVFKIENPSGGDSLRRFGSRSDAGDTFMWMSEARNKKSATLDLRTPEGAELFRKLVAQSDVVLENFRPGTLEKWGLGYEALAEINPRLVMLRVSAYGQTGPYSARPGFARIAHAFSGLAYLAGEPGRVPVVPGSTSLADYMSGLFGAIGVLIALRHAEKTGQGQEVDVGLYESMFRVLDELAPDYAAKGVQRERMGADVINIVPHSHYPTADGHYVALACSNDRMWGRLSAAMGRAELAQDPRYQTIPTRDAHRDEINAIVRNWTSALSLSDIVTRCDAEQVPVSKLMSVSDIFEDPQYAARENLQTIEDPRAGPLTLPGSVPRMSRTPPRLRHAGPALGDANEELFQTILGVSEERCRDLRARRII